MRKRVAKALKCEGILYEAHLDALRSYLCARRPRVRIGVLRSLTGGWTTSTRLHEVLRWKCVLGCPDGDSIGHYIHCPRFRVAVRQFWRDVPSLGTVEDVMTPEGWKLLYVLQRVYHTLKFDHHAQIQDMMWESDCLRRRRAVRDLAALARDIGHAAFRHFDDPGDCPG